MMLALMLASLMNVFVVESPSYAKEMVAAAHDLTARHSELHFAILTTEQILDMRPGDLRQSIEQAKVVILGRVYGDVAAKIQEAFTAARSRPDVVFAAHSDFGIYELSRYRGERPFRNITREQIEQISAGTLSAKDLPELRRW